MPQPSAFMVASKVSAFEKGVHNIDAIPGFIQPTERGKARMRSIAGWIIKALICLLILALGAWIYRATFVPSVVSQVQFTRQEQIEAKSNEIAVMPLHCKISKRDGFGSGTTIFMTGKALKNATQIDIFFKNPAGVYTFFMELRFRPFENSVFFTTQSEPQSWKKANDDYHSPSPLQNQTGGFFTIRLQTHPADMQVTISYPNGVATVYNYSHKEGFDHADSKEAIMSGNLESVSECKVL